jgi:hypothetical protein
MGPRAVLDAVVKRKIPNPHRESNPRTPIVQSVEYSEMGHGISFQFLLCSPLVFIFPISSEAV